MPWLEMESENSCGRHFSLWEPPSLLFASFISGTKQQVPDYPGGQSRGQ